MRMFPCCTHGRDDPDPQRAGRFASATQIASGAGGYVAFRLPAPRDRPDRRATYDGGVPGSLEGAAAGHSVHIASRGDPRRARPRVIVVDASAVVEVLLGTPAAAPIQRRLFDRGETLHAPHLLDIEVAHAVRRYAARGEIDGQRGRAALTDLADFPLYRYPHDPLLLRIWDLRHNFTAYDAVYVALAEELGFPLITRDRRLAGAV